MSESCYFVSLIVRIVVGSVGLGVAVASARAAWQDRRLLGLSPLARSITRNLFWREIARAMTQALLIIAAVNVLVVTPLLLAISTQAGWAFVPSMLGITGASLVMAGDSFLNWREQKRWMREQIS